MLLASISANKDAASRPNAIHVDTGASSTVSRPAISYITNEAQLAVSPVRMQACLDYSLGISEGLDFQISPPSLELENDVMDLEIKDRAPFLVSGPTISDIWAGGSSLLNFQTNLWPQGVSFHLLAL